MDEVKKACYATAENKTNALGELYLERHDNRDQGGVLYLGIAAPISRLIPLRFPYSVLIYMPEGKRHIRTTQV